MNKIYGTQLFNSGGITVHECIDGFTISDGVSVQVISFMPLLDESSLRQLLATDCSFQRLQVAKYGNTITRTKPSKNIAAWFEKFNNWFQHEAELLEMHSLGY